MIRDANPSFEAQVKVEFDWQEAETDHGATLVAGIDGVLHATITPKGDGWFDVVVGRAHYGLNLMTMCSDLDKGKDQAARMARQLLAEMCAVANEVRDEQK